MRQYLNLIIQLFSLAIALVPNLFYPAILGLHYHGEFIRLSALPYFAAYITGLPFDNLLLKEMAREKTLSLMEAASKLLWIKLLLANLLFFAASPFVSSQNIPAELFLLNSASISSFALSCVFADNNKVRMATLLGTIALAAVALGLSARAFALSPEVLVTGNGCLNVAVCLLACLVLRERLVGGARLHMAPMRIIRFFAISSALVTLSYGVVAFAAPFMAPARLSILRIAVSLAQATTTFFPVSQRTIMEQVSRLTTLDPDGILVVRYIRASLLVVGLVTFGASAAEMLILYLLRMGVVPLMPFGEYWGIVIVMTPALSLFLLASVLEKVIIGAVNETQAATFGITATVTTVAISLIALSRLTDGGFAAYTLSALAVAAIAALFLRIPFPNIWSIAVSIIAADLLLAFLACAAYEFGPNALLGSFCILSLGTVMFGFYLWVRQWAPLSEFLRS